ncbi:MAG: hypothetical protein Q8P92_04130 [Candidatus Daviesbacteria bacterium]|nr:hypothetical protein [Candidatus Daviesbacteria bacterium]
MAIWQIIKIILIVIIIILLSVFVGQVVFNKTYQFPPKIEYGVTFSSSYAQYLNLDWQETFIKVLSELKVKNLRIPTYWDALEKNKGEFSFADTDFMLSEAEKRNARVVLVVGFRQPRWPECYLPKWAAKLSLEEKRAEILQFVQKTVERYENNPSIWAYQVENEPFLPFFGENCDRRDPDFLKKEVDLVRSLSDKPIIITASGELEIWITQMQLSDIFGTTLYREVYNPLIGYVSYPILPYFYNLKSQIIRKVFAPQNQKTIISELQAEPWLIGETITQDPKRQTELFPVNKLIANIDYARKVGFDRAYLWGVEWWYWMEKMGYPEYLEYAKILFK